MPVDTIGLAHNTDALVTSDVPAGTTTLYTSPPSAAWSTKTTAITASIVGSRTLASTSPRSSAVGAVVLTFDQLDYSTTAMVELEFYTRQQLQKFGVVGANTMAMGFAAGSIIGTLSPLSQSDADIIENNKDAITSAITSDIQAASTENSPRQTGARTATPAAPRNSTLVNSATTPPVKTGGSEADRLSGKNSTAPANASAEDNNTSKSVTRYVVLGAVIVLFLVLITASVYLLKSRVASTKRGRGLRLNSGLHLSYSNPMYTTATAEQYDIPVMRTLTAHDGRARKHSYSEC